MSDKEGSSNLQTIIEHSEIPAESVLSEYEREISEIVKEALEGLESSPHYLLDVMALERTFPRERR